MKDCDIAGTTSRIDSISCQSTKSTFIAQTVISADTFLFIISRQDLTTRKKSHDQFVNINYFVRQTKSEAQAIIPRILFCSWQQLTRNWNHNCWQFPSRGTWFNYETIASNISASILTSTYDRRYLSTISIFHDKEYQDPPHNQDKYEDFQRNFWRINMSFINGHGGGTLSLIW